jgi:C4-type Zn-finger protein
MQIDLEKIMKLEASEQLRRLTEAIEQGLGAVIIIHDRAGASSFVFNSTGYEARRAVADTAVALEEHFREHIRKQIKEVEGK